MSVAVDVAGERAIAVKAQTAGVIVPAGSLDPDREAHHHRASASALDRTDHLGGTMPSSFDETERASAGPRIRAQNLSGSCHSRT